MTELKSDHVRSLSIADASTTVDSLCTPFSKLLGTALKKSTQLRHGSVLLASYSFGSPIAEWSLGNPSSLQRFTPCSAARQTCIGCKELAATWSDNNSLVFLLTNSAEVFKDTS